MICIQTVTPGAKFIPRSVLIAGEPSWLDHVMGRESRWRINVSNCEPIVTTSASIQQTGK
jgi:hypothetical protein